MRTTTKMMMMMMMMVMMLKMFVSHLWSDLYFHLVIQGKLTSAPLTQHEVP